MRLGMDAIDGDVEVVVPRLAAMDGHHVLVLRETNRTQRFPAGLKRLRVRRLLAVAPAEHEMDVRICRPRFDRDGPKFIGRRIERHGTLRLDRILAKRHLTGLRVDVRHAAQEVFALRHDVLDVDRRAVATVTANVSDEVAGPSRRASIRSAPSRPSRSM